MMHRGEEKDAYQEGYDAGYADGENEGRSAGKIDGQMRTDMFNGYLAAMRVDQAIVFRNDIERLSLEERRSQVVVHAYSAIEEIVEMMREVQWKPWKKGTDSLLVNGSTPRTIAAEAADVLHFLAHMLNICEVDDDMLNDAMEAARVKNADRQFEQYSYDEEKDG